MANTDKLIRPDLMKAIIKQPKLDRTEECTIDELEYLSIHAKRSKRKFYADSLEKSNNLLDSCLQVIYSNRVDDLDIVVKEYLLVLLGFKAKYDYNYCLDNEGALVFVCHNYDSIPFKHENTNLRDVIIDSIKKDELKNKVKSLGEQMNDVVKEYYNCADYITKCLMPYKNEELSKRDKSLYAETMASLIWKINRCQSEFNKQIDIYDSITSVKDVLELYVNIKDIMLGNVLLNIILSYSEKVEYFNRLVAEQRFDKYVAAMDIAHIEELLDIGNNGCISFSNKEYNLALSEIARSILLRAVCKKKEETHTYDELVLSLNSKCINPNGTIDFQKYKKDHGKK